MLSEVRKEAYLVRGKSATEDLNEENESSYSKLPATSTTSSSSTSSIIMTDDWVQWYPTEWIAWTQYGPASDNPSSHWVNEPISDGPVREFVDGVSGSKSSKKPTGRVNQREKFIVDKASTKLVADANSLKSTQILHAATELQIQVRLDDRNAIELMMKFAETEEDKVSYFT